MGIKLFLLIGLLKIFQFDSELKRNHCKQNFP